MGRKHRVIIAGTRTIDNAALVGIILENMSLDPAVDEIVHGAAKGVDSLAAAWAERKGFTVKAFPAEWSKYGRRAGFLRNTAMAEYAAALPDGRLILIWDGDSRGSSMMKRIAEEKGNR